MMNRQCSSSRLFAEPSFTEGVASVLDIGATLHKEYNVSKTEREADIKALHSDWHAIGCDIARSLSKHEQELTNTKP